MRSKVSLFISFVLATGLFVLVCDNDDSTTPPDPTDNNTIETAWDVNLPYVKEFTIPADDPAEVFHFGIGPKKAFASVIVIKVNLLEPTGTPFYLKAELLSEKQTPLVPDARESDLVPAVWVASRPEQTYYLRITPVGDPAGDRYRYRLEIASSNINDPFEPDDDTASATPVLLGIETTGAYLCDAFSDTLTPMASLPDFYRLELEDTTYLYVTIKDLGGDCKPLMRLYAPDGELFEEIKDTAAVFDLTGSGFSLGDWFLEVTDDRGFYPTYGEGEVAFNYLDPYTVLVSTYPQ
ncbi:hypothetical protein ES703_19362 [subsurface metagenome]|nr:hypothetical protein [bacterium]